MVIDSSIILLLNDVKKLRKNLSRNNYCLFKVIRHSFPGMDVWYDRQLWLVLFSMYWVSANGTIADR